MRAKCFDCAYRANVPGSCHSRCTFKWRGSGLEMPAGNPHGIAKGWYIFPLNYDPIWMIEICPAFSETRDPEMVAQSSPMDEILSIMGKRAI